MFPLCSLANDATPLGVAPAAGWVAGKQEEILRRNPESSGSNERTENKNKNQKTRDIWQLGHRLQVKASQFKGNIVICLGKNLTPQRC